MGAALKVAITLMPGPGPFPTSVSAVATTLGNTGPGLGEVGPLDNFAHLPTVSKWILTACMLFGRLEIYTLLILLFPEFWRK